MGYLSTHSGRVAVKELTLVEEIKKQKLVRRLLLLQQIVSPTEVLSFESVRTLLRHEPQTRTRYEALAVAEALEVTCDRELNPRTALKVYESAINLIGAATEAETTSCRPVVSLDLKRGLNLVERRLEREIQEEWNEDKREKLETILRQLRARKAILRDMHKIFLRLGFP